MNELVKNDTDLTVMQDLNETALSIFLMLGVFVIVFTLFGNGLVVASFYLNKRTRKKPNFFLLSLSVSDCLTAAVCMTLWNYFLSTGFRRMGDLYDFFMAVDSLCGVSSIMNILAVSVVRCSTIINPLAIRAQGNLGYIITAIVFPWGMGLIVSCLWLTVSVDWQHYYILVASVFYFLPLVMIIITYIIMIVISLQRKIARRRSRVMRKNIAAAKTMGIVVGCFIITWAPFFIQGPLVTYCSTCDLTFIKNHHIEVAAVVKFMQYSNSMMNPIIYAARLDDFRTSFKVILKKMFCFWNPEKKIQGRPLFRSTFRSSQTSNRYSNGFKTSSSNMDIRNSNSFRSATPDCCEVCASHGRRGVSARTPHTHFIPQIAYISAT